MGLKNTKTIGFNFKNERMEVLEMDIDFQREVPMNAARWDLWPEFMIESDEEQEDRHLLLIDLFLKLLPDTEAPPFALIRTRHRVHLYDIPARYVSDEVIALFLNNFVSQVRGYLKGFSMDHLHDLPHVHLLDPEELFRMVNVGIFHLHANEFAYERRILDETVDLPGSIEATLRQSRTQYFISKRPGEDGLSLDPAYDDDDDPDDDEPGTDPDEKEKIKYTLRLGMFADYETTDFMDWVLHLDIKFEMNPVAELLYRKSYSFQAPESSFVNFEFYKAVLQESWAGIFESFKQHCEARGIGPKVDDIPLGEEFFDMNARQMLEEYHTHVKPNFENNESFFFEQGVTITRGGNSLLMVKVTFVILDEILFLNPDFDHAHNQDAISMRNLPFYMYFTLKEHCLRIEEGKITLNWGYTFWFYMCLDMALQLLLNDQGDQLQERLLKRNISEFRQKEYIRFGTDFLTKINESLKNDGAEVNLVNDRIDWASIIR